MQAHLREFHLELQEGRGAIPIDLENPAILRKRYKADHQGAYVHRAGRGSAHSDVEVRMIVLVVAIPIYFILHEHKCKV